ncbi:beta-ketoacyl synthase family protein [Ruminiclostridium cellobioparum subsp. termitidis CT1112]|uniref:Phenolphthiocerol/phthiocerol polyketide synthase subunit E n=1 Tax=Ruminiclostridium cellobioparum subsp. termitidis CT1112 TaxID=1195236 RepID=S0FL91_RUMCE|nr:beta-ketoacyl synthase family protein [Ruminiclostridium cellobioparum subsp. termitidis CT1112]
MVNNFDESNGIGSIAIIGMGGRFPGAADMEEFWQNLYNGVESVKFFNREELLKMGIDENLLDNPRFVAADAILDGMDLFDASFFDYSAREAEIMDPQHRLYLETAWEVLESAGYNSELYTGRVAVYGSANLSGYMIRNLYSNPGLADTVGSFKIMLANGQDFLATKVSYKMNLTGPSVNVNTLCSSSLVAVHDACQNLMNFGCDLALAGGVSFQVSRNEAFFYQEGGIGSSDGHCRAYDSKANGTVSGSGLAIVALKRLEDAIADGDHIHAVIKGTGINNDGSQKNSYTAPNVDGQAECIAEAIAMSGVNPETITYIDGHGTGTDLGDPIEIAALTKAFRAYTKKKQFCAIGSVKTNIGHLVNAGGLASVVKTVLSMQNKVIPPSLNFEAPNPKIDFENSPFYVNTRLSDWKTDGFPLRAGVSSFGIGGTNTHVILEESPQEESSQVSKRPWQIISLSAKTGTALEKMTGNLIRFAKNNPDTNLADVAFTLHLGRRNFNHRRVLICRDMNDLTDKFDNMSPVNVFTYFQKPKVQPVVFMFPGEGEYVNMGAELYKTENNFRNTVDRCCEILQSQTGKDAQSVLYPTESDKERAAIQISDAGTGRGILFAVEYALAQLWMKWGVKPGCMIGEGIGEVVAACLSGVLSLEDALKLAVSEDSSLPETVSRISNGKVNIPFISCITGGWITDTELGSPDYWIRQRGSFRFGDGLNEIMKDADQILLEIGPGNKLTIEAEKYKNEGVQQAILYSMPGKGEGTSDCEALFKCLGMFGNVGGRVDWNQFYVEEKRHRIPLPTYPFERQRYWIEPGRRGVSKPDVLISRKEDITSSITDSEFKEASITITLKLDEQNRTNSNEERKKQLEEFLALKERLEELSKEVNGSCTRMDVSPLGLKTSGGEGQFGFESNEKLKKRPRPDLESAYVAPANEIESAIIEKWQEVLGFDRIGIHDDFFELGGHSLIAAAVATDLSKKFDVQIPMRKLFETTTAAGIAQLIETFRWATEGVKEAASSEQLEGGTI